MKITSANQLNRELSRLLADTESNIYYDQANFTNVIVTRYKSEVDTKINDELLMASNGDARIFEEHIRAIQEKAIKDLRLEEYVQNQLKELQGQLDALNGAVSSAITQLEEQRESVLAEAIAQTMRDNSKMGLFNTGKAEGMLEALRIIDKLRKKE